jgi:hypothetical protein
VGQAGWTQTFPPPPGTHNFGIDCGQLVNLQFGNMSNLTRTPTRTTTPTLTRTRTFTPNINPPD